MGESLSSSNAFPYALRLRLVESEQSASARYACITIYILNYK